MRDQTYHDALLHSIFHNTQTGMVVCDVKKNHLEMVNAAFAHLYGYEHDELIGMALSKIFSPECMQQLHDYETSKHTAQNLSFETTHFKKDGTPIKVSVTVFAIKDAQGNVQKIVLSSAEKTSHPPQESIFQSAHATLEADNSKIKEFALNKVNEAVFLLDEHSRFHYVNESASRSLGYTKEELLTLGVVDIDPNMSLEIWKEHWKDIKKNKITLMVSAHTRKDGTTFPIEVSSNYFEYNGVGYSIAVSRDITERIQAHKELQNREEMFRTLAENIPDNIVRWDLQGRYVYVNPKFATTVHMNAKEIIGKRAGKLFGTHTHVVNAIKQVKKTHKALFGTLQELRNSDGTHDIHEVNVIPEFDENGKMISILGIGRDITKLKTYERELKKQKDFQETLLSGIAKAGMSVNVIEEGRYIYTNNLSLAKEYGYDETLFDTKPSFLDTIHPDDKERVSTIYQKRLAGENLPSNYTIRLVNIHDEIKEHELSVVLIPDTQPIQTLIVTKDVTEQKNIERRIEFMAHHDVLTGLPNRVLLQERVTSIIAHSKNALKKFALLFIDLDGFKTINDSLGHTMGDTILTMVAQKLQECTSAVDILSRHGGDEFMLIIPEVDNDAKIERVIRTISQEFQKSFEINQQRLSITASIGIAMYPEHGETFEQLAQSADTAMHKAKENGKNTHCFFTQQMQHNLIGLLKMQNDLKEAINNKEFVLHYQPQIDLSHTKIVGAEALLRWQHPTMGMIPPLTFIPIAESSGYIVEIGEWVIQEACHQAALWHKQGNAIVVAVNVSAIQFKRGNLIEVTKNALSMSGLSPQYLELELTESLLISDTDHILQAVRAIKALGVQLSIDDFGTGYSSLSYLKRFAVDKLKIDQSFVRDIVQDKEDATIVKTIIQMAKSFNLKSIAEGVESEEVLDALKEFGCDEAQGYYFAKPMPSKEFEAYCNHFG